MFTAMLRAYADRRHRAIIGEKTPAHIRWADTLLEWYPTARIVHMVRDPRGVYRSELRRRTGRPESLPYRWLVTVPPLMRGFILLEVAWAWAAAVAHHRDLSRRHPDNYRMVRFEDLVQEPGAEVERLCAFLGVAPEASMLEQKVVSVGDRLGEAGFDAGAAARWRTSITPGEARWLPAASGVASRRWGIPGRDAWRSRARASAREGLSRRARRQAPGGGSADEPLHEALGGLPVARPHVAGDERVPRGLVHDARRIAAAARIRVAHLRRRSCPSGSRGRARDPRSYASRSSTTRTSGRRSSAHSKIDDE